MSRRSWQTGLRSLFVATLLVAILSIAVLLCWFLPVNEEKMTYTSPQTVSGSGPIVAEASSMAMTAIRRPPTRDEINQRLNWALPGAAILAYAVIETLRRKWR